MRITGLFRKHCAKHGVMHNWRKGLDEEAPPGRLVPWLQGLSMPGLNFHRSLGKLTKEVRLQCFFLDG